MGPRPRAHYVSGGVVYDPDRSVLLAEGRVGETGATEDGMRRIWLYRGEGGFFVVELQSNPGRLTVEPVVPWLAEVVYRVCERQLRPFGH
jgi:hypothetical protein